MYIQKTKASVFINADVGGTINISACNNLNGGFPDPDFNHTQHRHDALAYTLLAE